MNVSLHSVFPICLRDIVCFKIIGKVTANLIFYNTSESKKDKLQNVEAVVFKSKIYVIHGYTRSKHDNGNHNYGVDMAAVVHCFYSAKNEWEQQNINLVSSFWIQSLCCQ